MKKKLLWGSIIVLVLVIFIVVKSTGFFKKGKTEIDDSTRIANAKFINDAPLLRKKYSLTCFNNDSLCLWGKYALDMDVTLIDFENKEVIHAKTISYDVFKMGEERDMSEVITKLTNWPKNADGNKKYIAILSNKDNIKFLDLKEINNKEMYRKIDSTIKAENTIRNYQDIDSMFIKTTFRIEEVIANSFTFHVITYEDADVHSSPGPRLILLPNGKLKAIAGPCTSEEFRVYSIDDDVYIHTASGFCGNGENGYQVFKITPNKVEVLFEDYEFTMFD